MMITQLLLLNSAIALELTDTSAEADVPVETVEIEQPSRKYFEKPAPLQAPSFTLPELERGELSNGIPVLVSNNSENTGNGTNGIQLR